MVLKVELHSHTDDDPCDRIPHTTEALVDRAAALGYGAVAITLHDHQLDLRPFVAYAERRGVVLIPGVERTIEGAHVLLLNFVCDTSSVRTFKELARIKASSDGLVIAPHPFFRLANCVGRHLDRHTVLFDAVEYNAMFTRYINFNTRAVEWAAVHGKPVVGAGDVHRLRQMGTTYSLVDVDGEPTPSAICSAIKRGRVEVRAEPMSIVKAGVVMADILAAEVFPRPWAMLTGFHAKV